MEIASATPNAVLASLSGSLGSVVKTWNAATRASRPNSTGSSRGTPPAAKQLSPIRTACSRNGRRASPPHPARRRN
jgi:hypothetical protein